MRCGQQYIPPINTRSNSEKKNIFIEENKNHRKECIYLTLILTPIQIIFTFITSLAGAVDRSLRSKFSLWEGGGVTWVGVRKRDLGDVKIGLRGFPSLIGVLPEKEASIVYQMEQWVGVRVKVRASIRIRVSMISIRITITAASTGLSVYVYIYIPFHSDNGLITERVNGSPQHFESSVGASDNLEVWLG